MSRTWTDTDIEALIQTPFDGATTHREFNVPGLMLRRGKHKKVFELRIEGRPPVRRVLVEGPAINAATAIQTAQDMRARHKAGKPIDAPTPDQVNIRLTWPDFEKHLNEKGGS